MNNKSGKKHKRKQPKNKKKQTKCGGGPKNPPNSKLWNKNKLGELTEPLLPRQQRVNNQASIATSNPQQQQRSNNPASNQPVAPPIPNSPKNVKPFGTNAIVSQSRCSIM